MKRAALTSMSRWFAVFVTMSAPAVAEEVADSERLHAEIPETWVKVVDRQAGNLHIQEYLPPESPIPWQQKLSYEAMGGRGLPDPLVFVDGLAVEQKALCNGFEDTNIFVGFENGYPSVVRMLQCHENKRTGKPIVTMIKAIKGNAALYTVTRIWRLEPPVPQLQQPDTAVAPEKPEIAAWSQVLRRVQACDVNLDAHPCE